MSNEKLLINDNKSNNSDIKSNNEIEEMVKILQNSKALTYEPNTYELYPHCRNERNFYVSANDGHLTIDYNELAKSLYEQGYRKQIESKWVMIPVDGVARYRCGNIDCCRLIPFGCSPNELDYCPFCGARMKGGESDG